MDSKPESLALRNADFFTIYDINVMTEKEATSIDPPQSVVKSEFTYLLGTWCPGNAPPPSAYLVDTSEEALLLPDWLKLRMIRSSVDQLVIAALQDLEPAQLVLFIQSFGIPVQSMSKLLAHLDAAVVQMPQAMDAAVVDKSYMAQLVEVQQMRGAQGGYQFLGLLNHQPKEEEKGKSEDT
eukprot:XP_011670626.1 PREDICTED: integrator complex subunit 1-like [Strongylocentrotus purpuratus]